jgi:polar amino acid transport system substrate-binding protein
LIRTAGHGVSPLRLCLPAALVWLGLWPAAAVAHCEKTLRWDDDPPFSMQLPNGDIIGIDVELNRSVLEHMGCHVRMRKLPWARALRELKQGRLDVLPGTFRLPERAEYAYFSGTILPASRNILFLSLHALPEWRVARLTELQETSFRLGAQIGVYYGADFEQVMEDTDFFTRVIFQTRRDSLWRMLGKGRVDGVIANEHTGVYETHLLGLDSLIRPTKVVVSNEASEVAFSKLTTDPEFVERYRVTLRQMVSDGSYQRILQRYLPPALKDEVQSRPMNELMNCAPPPTAPGAPRVAPDIGCS